MGLPELELQPQGCETVKFLLIQNINSQGLLLASAVTNPLARRRRPAGLDPWSGKTPRAAEQLSLAYHSERAWAQSLEPSYRASTGWVATRKAAPRASLGHRRSPAARSPRAAARGQPRSLRLESPGAARKPGAAVDTYRHLYKTKRALTDGERARQKRGRRQRAHPERAARLTAPSSLLRLRRAAAGSSRGPLKLFLAPESPPGPRPREGLFFSGSHLPSLHPSLDPGALRLEEEMDSGAGWRRCCAVTGKFCSLSSSCSWARLDGLTEPQKLRASKAPPSGGGFS